MNRVLRYDNFLKLVIGYRVKIKFKDANDGIYNYIIRIKMHTRMKCNRELKNQKNTDSCG